MEISVEGSVNEIIRSLDAHPATVAKATTMALNKTASRVQTRAIRAIRDRTGLKSSSVRRRMKIVKAYGSRLLVSIRALPYAPNVASYGGKQVKEGVRHRAWQRTQIAKGAFLIHGRTAMTRVGKSRLPIKPLYGPSLPKNFGATEIENAMNKTVRENFPTEFLRALRALWQRAGL